ncbi:MAG: hypothetical protein LC751_18105 [Actinobacteria bacterium]|nr:hypothetical protein [Actinomycetota bacterium]MCA1738118.1 hypothetical protein [Actinomycetota bacterium]
MVEAAIALPIPDEREAGSLGYAAGRLSAPGAILAGPVARAVAAGTILALVPKAPNYFRGRFLPGTR